VEQFVRKDTKNNKEVRINSSTSLFINEDKHFQVIKYKTVLAKNNNSNKNKKKIKNIK